MKDKVNITAVKEFTFDAAHFIPNHPGKCKKTHGHTYKLQIGVTGLVKPETGMVLDFGDLKQIVNTAIIEELDHHFLNAVEVKNFPKDMPTAECMVEWLVGVLKEIFLVSPWSGISLSFVRLYETPTSYAEWRA